MKSRRRAKAARSRGATTKSLTRCRMCGSTRLKPYLDLGKTPLANSYLRKSDLGKPEFKEKLTLQLCLRCGLSQLTKVVHPDRMFRHYLYVSSTTETIRSHWAELAQSAAAWVSARPGDLALDIASNDGGLLSKFRDLHMRVVGVDPAQNLAREANRSGIPTICAYWNTAAARQVAARFGRPSIVTSTNVVAHVDDVNAFARAVRECLAPDGVWVIEVPYLLDFIARNEFDTAYHEHLSYIGIHPLSGLMARHGFRILDIRYFPKLHGGTIRVFCGRARAHRAHPSVAAFLGKEKRFGIRRLERYTSFAKRVLANRERLLVLLHRLHAQGKTIWAYGASAKGNTLMNFFGVTDKIVPVAIDDNPKKWRWYTPGSHMRISGISELKRSRVDYLLLLAWNFKDEILRRCETAGYTGQFIVPVPRVHVMGRRARGRRPTP